MINTQKYLEKIETSMAALTWVSPDGSGTTSFVEVYTYPMWSHDQGYPYLVLLDNPIGFEASTTDTCAGEFTNNIEFHICANYSVREQVE